MLLRPGVCCELTKAAKVTCGPWLSTGVVPGVGADAGDIPYEQSAVVPRLPWREPTDAEREMLSRLPGHNGGPIIRVFPLRDEWTTPLRRLVARQAHLTFGPEEAFKTATSVLLEGLTTLSRGKADVVALGVKANAPGLATVTVDRSINKRIGLHLDSWDKVHLEQRPFARNRINVNLSREPRSFLFCNLPVTDMHMELQMDRAVVGTQIGRRFFHICPDYPVVCVSVPPGWAYLAPTELLVHDGATLGRKDIDLSFAALGHF